MFHPLGSFILILAACLGNPALADPQSKSWSRWTAAPGGLAASYTIATRELGATASSYALHHTPAQLLAAELRSHLQLETELGHCELQQTESVPAKPGFVRLRLLWQCPPGAVSASLSNTALLRAAPSHIHFARFELPGQPPFERLFSSNTRRHQLQLQAGDERPATTDVYPLALTYTLFGFEHILIGMDHIAFLLGLLLFSQRLRDVIMVITGFTLGHSLTLGMTALGLLTPQQSMVEGLIGFTIAIVAVENVIQREARPQQAGAFIALAMIALALAGAVAGGGPAPLGLLGIGMFSYCYLKLAEDPGLARGLRPALTVLFGMVHGFGFAGVLLEVGLPANEILPALLGFNIGVELGQLTIVLALVLPGLMLSRLHKTGASSFQLALNVGLCGLGSFWFLQRLYFSA
jgi:hypothetical protein